MKVTELPKGHEYVMNKEELQAFAQAVIEDYKAGLVPVYTVGEGWNCHEFPPVGTKFYALPSGETK